MNQPIEIRKNIVNGHEIQTVNARQLHAYLEVGKDFSTWLKDRIGQYDFIENQDFVCSPVSGSEGGGHTDDNLATACFACNRSKAAKNAEEWRKL